MNKNPYIIGEIGTNFNGSLSLAKELMVAGKESGVDCVKFQLFSGASFKNISEEEFFSFEKFKLNDEFLEELVEHSNAIGIDFLASVFDQDLLRRYLSLDVGAIKIASSEVTNYGLIQAAAKSGNKIYLSTGMSDYGDVEFALDICEAENNFDIVLFQCTASYPCPPDSVNLSAIEKLSSAFDYECGFSDHSEGNHLACCAVGLGCRIFEKHFTMDKNSIGPDHFFASDIDGLREYVRVIHECMEAKKPLAKKMTSDERKEGRRSGIYAKHRLLAGDTLNVETVRFERPALGLRDKYFHAIQGARVKRTLEKDDPISLQDLEL